MEKVFHITEVSHFNPDTFWFVAKDEDVEESIVGTAILPPYGRLDCECELRPGRGQWGPQYFVTKIKYESIEDIIEPLLASGFLAHIRVSKAAEIVATLGKEFFNVLEVACDTDEPIDWKGEMMTPKEILMLVNGIGEFIADELIKAWEKKRYYFRAAIDAIRCGLAPRQFRWAISQSGYEEFCAMVHSDAPYVIYDLLEYGLSWEEVDAIAMTEWEDKPAIDPGSPIRMAGAIKYALHNITASEGHMFASETAINAECLKLGIENVIDKVGDLEKFNFIPRGDFIYSKDNFEIEKETAEFLIELSKQDLGPNVDSDEIKKFSDGLILNPSQVEAVRNALRYNVSVITGGPGTGKTTVLNTIVRMLKSKGQQVVLCAPTGNAARRMKTATGHEAATLHRYFQLFRPALEQEVCTHGNIAIDEMSMTSSDIFRDILRNILPGVHVILVGDTDQLPPVGKGEPLLQVIESKLFPVVHLTNIYRQKEGSAIIEACHAINRGEMPAEDAVDSQGNPTLPENRTVIIKSYARSELKDACMKAFNWLQAVKGAHPDDIQILTPINKDSRGKGIGQKELNLTVRNVTNPDWEANQTPVKNLSVQDRILQTKNNYQLGDYGIMNGQIGKINALTEEGAIVMRAGEDTSGIPSWMSKSHLFSAVFEDDELALYTAADAMNLSLAYAMTIHKSQGGQFPHVIMIVPHIWQGFRYRQLVYTGASRPRETLIILEEKGALQTYIENETKLRRFSGLAQMLREIESKRTGGADVTN